MLLIVTMLFIALPDLQANVDFNFDHLTPNQYEGRRERTTEFIRRRDSQPIGEISEEQRLLSFEGNIRFDQDTVIDQLFLSSTTATHTITNQALELDLFNEPVSAIAQQPTNEVDSDAPSFLLLLATASILLIIGLSVILYIYYKSTAQD